MRVLFHANQLCLRGGSVAFYDYADFNESLLHNESFLIYNLHSHNNNVKAFEKFSARFGDKLFAYTDKQEIDSIADALKIDFCYFMKHGNYDGLVSKKPTGIHAVFQSYDFHGDIYAYISEWLSNHMTRGKTPFVPYMVYLPEPSGTMRTELQIPEDAFVFGRHGGHDQFDIQFAQESVIEFALKNPNVYFLFANTYKFIDHPRIKFIPGFADMQTKANFVATCDAMIHARSMGESFGLAICESLYGNKPVLAWRGGDDQNHSEILKYDYLLYADKQDLLHKMQNITSIQPTNYRHLVEKFNPMNVMWKFHDVFLENA